MNMNNIIHINIEKDYRNRVNQHQLQFSANAVLDYSNENNIEFTISIVGEEKIRELNRNYRSIDSETDVLSFSADEINPETGKTIIGDVIISFPMAEKQSKALDQQICDELNLLTIHGVLHLLGYDHQTKEGEKHMFALQANLMQGIREALKKKS